MSTLTSHMNWRNDTPFSAMTGTFSLTNLISNVKGSEFDFSHPSSLHEVRIKSSNVNIFPHISPLGDGITSVRSASGLPRT